MWIIVSVTEKVFAGLAIFCVNSKHDQPIINVSLYYISESYFISINLRLFKYIKLLLSNYTANTMPNETSVII